MGQRYDPLDLVVKAAGNPDYDPIIISGTLQLVDATGIPVDYISGSLLNQTMQQVFKRAFGPLNEERRRRLAVIDDWALTPELVDRLTSAIVEPQMDAFAGEHAALVHLSCVVLRLGLVDMPVELWWTPMTIQRLRVINPNRDRELGFSSISKMVSYTNFNCYHFTTNSIARRDLPLRLEGDPMNLFAVHSLALTRIVRALLMTLVD